MSTNLKEVTMQITGNEHISLGEAGALSVYKAGEANVAVLCIHGFQGSMRDFEALGALSSLATLIIPDLPGHGKSLKAGVGMDVKSIAEILTGLLDSFGVKKCVIVAHSIGGAIGVELAARNTDRVVGLVNCEGNLIGSDCGIITRSIAELSDSTAYEKTDGFIDFKNNVPDASAASLKSLADSVYQASCSNSLYEQYVALSVPKLFIFGSRSENKQLTQKLLESGQSIRCMQGAGHIMMKDSPGEFYEIVKDFVASVRGSSA